MKEAELFGLVLAGGKSTRMGIDKSQINYKGQNHEIYTAKLISKYCSKTFISKSNSKDDTIDGFEVIKDKIQDRGPLGAIYSAFMNHGDKAYLVVACDLPFLDDELIKNLVSIRDKTKDASCIKSPERNFPEPLISIYEPSIFPQLESAIAMGHSCPNKVLIKSDIKIKELNSAIKLFNANTIEQMKQVEQQLNNNKQ